MENRNEYLMERAMDNPYIMYSDIVRLTPEDPGNPNEYEKFRTWDFMDIVRKKGETGEWLVWGVYDSGEVSLIRRDTFSLDGKTDVHRSIEIFDPVEIPDGEKFDDWEVIKKDFNNDLISYWKWERIKPASYLPEG